MSRAIEVIELLHLSEGDTCFGQNVEAFLPTIVIPGDTDHVNELFARPIGGIAPVDGVEGLAEE